MMNLKSIPPGIPFLLRTLVNFSLGPVVTLFIVDLLRTQFHIQAPRWLSVVVTVLNFPIWFATRVAWQSWRESREAERMGARLAPVINGKWIGNVDVLIDMMKLTKVGYPGENQVEPIRTLGNIFNIRIFWENILVTVEPEHIKAILATQFPNYVKGEKFNYSMAAVLGTGVFNSDGDMWKFHRSMTRPFFSRDRISHFDIFDRHADEAIGKIKRRLNEGIAVDFQDLISRFTLDSATEFLFGSDVRSLSAPLPYPYSVPGPSQSHSLPFVPSPSPDTNTEAKSFAESFVIAQDAIANRVKVGSIWPMFEVFKDQTREPMRIVSGYVDKILCDVLEKKKNGQVVDMEAKIEAGVDEDGETLLEHLIKLTSDPVVLKDEILNILLAGRDTTASTLTFTIYLLAMNPTVLSRLRAEILEKVGPMRRPTYDDIKGMKYLRAVLNETLRLYPAVPFNVRQTLHATTLSSPDPTQKPIYVPANTTVSYSVFFLHRRKDLWGPDAEEYDPDRFLDERLKKYLTPNPFIFLPFNAGPRICLGQQFAYNEMSFMLIRLLQNFSGISLESSAHAPDTLPPKHWERGEGRMCKERLYPKSHLTIYSHGGLWVSMTEAERQKEMEA